MDEFRLDRRPLYVQAHDRLLALIDSGDLLPGDRLPSEELLARQLGIARATLREALRLLEDEGTIIRRHGVGTFVAVNQHLESGLERLESVLALAARQGVETRVQDLEVELIQADRTLSERMQIERGASVTRVRRTIIVEDQPAAFMEDLVPSQWLSPDDINQTFRGSVLDLLRMRNSPRIQEAQANITAARAGGDLAKRLGVPRGAALLLLEETLFDADGVPMGFSHNYFVPDRFRFHVIRR